MRCNTTIPQNSNPPIPCNPTILQTVDLRFRLSTSAFEHYLIKGDAAICHSPPQVATGPLTESIEIHQNPPKSIKIHQNPLKSIKIHLNPSKST